LILAVINIMIHYQALFSQYLLVLRP